MRHIYALFHTLPNVNYSPFCFPITVPSPALSFPTTCSAVRFASFRLGPCIRLTSHQPTTCGSLKPPTFWLLTSLQCRAFPFPRSTEPDFFYEYWVRLGPL
jgi:hypothetical protein